MDPKPTLPASESMQNQVSTPRRSLKPFFIIAGILLLISAVALLLYLKLKVTTSEVRSWKEYNNQTLGIFLKYPSNWTVVDEKNSAAEVVTFKGREGNITIAWGANTVDSRLQQVCGIEQDTLKENQMCQCGLAQEKKLTINNELKDMCSGENQDGTEFWDQIYWQKGETTITIGGRTNPPTDKNRDIILKALSTFKFNDQINDKDSSNLKLYQDAKNKFEFYYPSSYVLTTWGENLPLLNHNIMWEVRDSDECRGDCLTSPAREKILTEPYEIYKGKGTIGVIAGNIPQSYIKYSIKYPMQEKYLIMTLYELPWDDYTKTPFERTPSPISNDEEKQFDILVRTVQFM